MPVHDIAPGAIDFSSTSAIPLIQEKWANQLTMELLDITTLTLISNTKYEGEIKKDGDTVWIYTMPDINILPYFKGGTTISQTPQPTRIALTIDRTNYFDIVMDKIDKAQMLRKSWQDEFVTRGGKNMKIFIEKLIFGTIYTQAHVNNQGVNAGKISNTQGMGINLGTTGTPVVLTSNNIVKKFTEMRRILNEQNVPEENRTAIIPAWAEDILLNSSLAGANFTGDATSPLRNGVIGKAANFTIATSNLLPYTADGSYIFFGHPMALAFATQVRDTEIFTQLEATLGTKIRAFNTYGYKVIQPEAFGVLYATGV